MIFPRRAVAETTTVPVGKPHYYIQSVVATGGVYKGQGRSQREMLTRTY